MKFESIMTGALFLSLTDAAAPGYGYEKGLSKAIALILPGPLADKFAGAIGKGPLGHGIAPLTGTGYDGVGQIHAKHGSQV
jgi:hypothetical protein